MHSRRASIDSGKSQEITNILPKSEKYLLAPFERDFTHQTLYILEVDITKSPLNE
jgi:hypothetical protein